MKISGKIIWREVKSLFIIILIALALRATVVEAYIVPTGSMENTIMTGDFLIGNKFIYGMRTPDWLGIPYTDIGAFIPCARFPKFRNPKQEDVVIFKYPRDVFQKYVKRLIGMPGQTVEIREKRVIINGEEFNLPPKGKYKDPQILSPDVNRRGEIMFLRDGGNRDNLGPFRVPKKGDIIEINKKTNWDYLIPIMLMDNHEVRLHFKGRTFIFTMDDPIDLSRRYSSSLWLKIRGLFTNTPPKLKKLGKMRQRYYSYSNSDGYLLNVWNFNFSEEVINYLSIDGKPLRVFENYEVEQNYYWMMGDNRDDSADSRYWGFVPHDHVLGVALFAYMSWDFKNNLIRYWRIGEIIS